jgi:predicted RNase H-like HicB family nuclease
MLEAMELLEDWLKKYKKEKRDEYEYLPLELINKYENRN